MSAAYEQQLEVDLDTRIGVDLWQIAYGCEHNLTLDVLASLLRVVYARGYDHAAYDRNLSLYRDNPVTVIA